MESCFPRTKWELHSKGMNEIIKGVEEEKGEGREGGREGRGQIFIRLGEKSIKTRRQRFVRAVHIAVSRGSFSDCQKRDSFEKPSEELVSFRVNYRPRNLRPQVFVERDSSITVSGEEDKRRRGWGR